MNNNRLKNNYKQLIPAHKIALNIVEKRMAVTAEILSQVLSFSGLNITQESLDALVGSNRLVFTNLSLDTLNSSQFKDNLGTMRDRVPGVYIWTHISTGNKYVGSSTQLARRLAGYFKGTHADAGKFLPLLYKEGLSAFNLEVIVLKNNYVVNHELFLEQYFLLHSEFNLNTLRVVNSILGARSKSLYMYTKDLSELIHSSSTQEEFIFKLNIHHSTFSKCLDTGSLTPSSLSLWEREEGVTSVVLTTPEAFFEVNLVFTTSKSGLGRLAAPETKDPVPGAKVNNMSITQIKCLLDQDRLVEKDSKRKSSQILLRDVDNSDNTKVFDSVKACLEFLNTIGNSSKTTLLRRISNNEPYHGYICEWYGEKVSRLKDKAMEVVVTDVTTSEVVSYTSFNFLKKKIDFFLKNHAP